MLTSAGHRGDAARLPRTWSGRPYLLKRYGQSELREAIALVSRGAAKAGKAPFPFDHAVTPLHDAPRTFQLHAKWLALPEDKSR